MHIGETGSLQNRLVFHLGLPTGQNFSQLLIVSHNRLDSRLFTPVTLSRPILPQLISPLLTRCLALRNAYRPNPSWFERFFDSAAFQGCGIPSHQSPASAARLKTIWSQQITWQCLRNVWAIWFPLNRRPIAVGGPQSGSRPPSTSQFPFGIPSKKLGTVDPYSGTFNRCHQSSQMDRPIQPSLTTRPSENNLARPPSSQITISPILTSEFLTRTCFSLTEKMSGNETA